MADHVTLQSDGRPLPYGYRWLFERGLTDFGPWYLISEQSDSDAMRQEFVKETSAPNPSQVKDFQPFAKAAGNDDVAGFVIRSGKVSKEVLLVHLTWSSRPELEGYPGMTLYSDVWEWFADCVVGEMKYVAENEEEYYEKRSKQ
jgi:hypothetical protein